MSEVTRSLGLPEHAVNYGEVDMHHAIRKGKEHGISFLTPDEIRQQMLPFIQQFNIEANEGCFRLSSPRPTREKRSLRRRGRRQSMLPLS
jgi:hypothetical protein